MNSTFPSSHGPISSLWTLSALLLAGRLGAQPAAKMGAETAVGATVETAAAQAAATFDSPCGSEADFFAALAVDHGVQREQVPYREIRIHEEESDYVLELDSRDGTQRKLRDSSCSSLFSAAVVIVTSAVQGSRAGSEVDSELSGDVAVPVASPAGQSGGPGASEKLAPEQAVPLATSAAPGRSANERGKNEAAPSRGRLRPSAFAGTGLSFALHPDVAVLVEGGLGLGYRQVGLTLLGRYQFPTESLTAGTIGLRLESAGGRLAAYYAPAAWLHMETGPSVLGLSGVGVGLARPESSVVWMVAQEFELSARLPVAGPWGLEVGLRGWVSLNQPRFELDDGREVYRVPRVGLGVFLHGIWQPR